MSNERKHHPFGCSKWPDLKRCAGYEADGKSSPAAARGTRIHKYWEEIGKGRTEFPDDIEPDEYVGASWAAAIIKEMAGNHDAQWELWVESTSPEYFGYLDVLWEEDDGATVVIVDGKSGQSNPEQWIQLVGYSHAYMQKHPDCTLAICRLVYWDTRTVKEYHFTRLEVLNNVNELLTWIEGGERHVGVQCMRCSRWKSCDQIKGALFRGWMASQDGESISRTPEEMGELKHDLDLLENLRKKVGEEIRGMLESETDVPGYKLYSRKGSSKVDTAQAWEHTKGQLTAGDFLSCCKPDLKKLRAMHEMRTGEEFPEELVVAGAPIQVLKKSS